MILVGLQMKCLTLKQFSAKPFSVYAVSYFCGQARK